MSRAVADLRMGVPFWRKIETKNLGAYILAVVLIVLQSFPLIWRIPFATDWVNHVWLIAYFADFFSNNYWFPTTVDVAKYFGEPAPLFYGMFFYPLMVPLSLLLGPDLALRFISFLLLVIPVVTYFCLFRSILGRACLSVLFSITVNSSVYQITNLYSRSAITEFIAGQFLLISISLIFYGLIGRSRVRTVAIYSGYAFAAISFGSHPITFYTFSVFMIPLLCLLCLVLLKVVDRHQLKHVLFGGAALFAVLLPWIYLVLEYRADTAIHASLKYLVYFPGSIDSLWARLGVFYVDSRVFVGGIKETATPFLDAPFSVGLLAAVVFTGTYSVSRSVFAKYFIPCAIFIVLIFICTTPPIPNVMLQPPAFEIRSYANESLVSRIFAPIQFAYRLAAAFGLVMAFLLPLGLVFRYKLGEQISRSSSLFVALCAGASILLLAHKASTTYLHYVMYPSVYLHQTSLELSWDEYLNQIQDVGNYPATFYGPGAYSMPKVYPGSDPILLRGRQRLNLNFTEWHETQNIYCETSCVLATNVLPSHFSQIMIDGRMPRNEVYVENGMILILADRGSHEIGVAHRGRIPLAIGIAIGVALIWFYASTFFLVLAVIGPVRKSWRMDISRV